MSHVYRYISLIVIAVCFLPSLSYAFPFGGSIGQIVFCYNNAIYTSVGPPNGGAYIWAPSTKTYQFGPPSHTGQWLLGLAAPPYYCLVSIQPIIVWAGTLMTMEGSSGAAAPGVPGGGLGGGSGGGIGGGGSGGGNGGAGSGIGHLVVSEVYYQADAAHGGKAENQWIEIFNPTNVTVDVSRWALQTASSSQLVRSGTTISANGYMVFAATTSVRTAWNIPSTVPVATFTNAFPGFLANGDHVFLVDTQNNRIDAVSYARDTTAFSPSVPAALLGRSILRKNLVTDTDTANDWVDTSTPNPGR